MKKILFTLVAGAAIFFASPAKADCGGGCPRGFYNVPIAVPIYFFTEVLLFGKDPKQTFPLNLFYPPPAKPQRQRPPDYLTPGKMIVLTYTDGRKAIVIPYPSGVKSCVMAIDENGYPYRRQGGEIIEECGVTNTYILKVMRGEITAPYPHTYSPVAASETRIERCNYNRSKFRPNNLSC